MHRINVEEDDGDSTTRSHTCYYTSHDEQCDRDQGHKHLLFINIMDGKGNPRIHNILLYNCLDNFDIGIAYKGLLALKLSLRLRRIRQS